MRCVVISKWEPGRFKEVSERFFSFLDGNAPQDILDAYKKIKFEAFEFPSAYGQNCSVAIAEAEEKTLATFLRYWADLETFEIMPSVPLEVLTKMGPKK